MSCSCQCHEENNALNFCEVCELNHLSYCKGCGNGFDKKDIFNEVCVDCQ